MDASTISHFRPPLITPFHSITHITMFIVNLYLNVMYPLQNLEYYVKNSSNMQLSSCMSHCHTPNTTTYIPVNNSDTLTIKQCYVHMRLNLILTTGLCFACSVIITTFSRPILCSFTSISFSKLLFKCTTKP